MKSPRSPRGASYGVLVLLLGTAGASAAEGAQTTWADPAGVCNGQSPCFATLAAAVANAGPPPATVFAFPGIYPESIDLATMGSALPGGIVGELSLVSVDATGMPAPGAMVDPAAPGGPGTGPAIFANPFPAALGVDGFVVRSPDDTGLLLFADSTPVTVSRVNAENTGSNGIGVLTQSGSIDVDGCTARFNDEVGIVAFTLQGAVTVAGSFAERNGDQGFVLLGGEVTVSDSRAEANTQAGFDIRSTGGPVHVTSVEALLNEDGLVVFPSGPDLATLVEIDGALVDSNLNSGLGVLAERIVATGVAAHGNGGGGGVFLATEVEVTDSTAEGNVEQGLFLGGGVVVGERLVATANGGTGIGVGQASAATSFLLADVEATGNGSGISAGLSDPTLTFASGTVLRSTVDLNQDAGIVAGAETLLFDDVTATGNGGTGITALAVDTRLVDCRSAGNLTGFLTTGERVTLLGCSATANGPFGGGTFDGNGFVLAQVDRVEIADALALDNDFGWLILDLAAPVAPAGVDLEAARRELERLAAGLPRRPRVQGGAAPQEISIVTSRTEGSTGASMQLALREQGTLSVRCSDFVANGSAGLALFTDNEVDARGSFWRDPSGPTHPNNPAGTGDAIHDAAGGFAGTVLFDPFLEAPASASDCLLPGEALEIPTVGPGGLLLLALALALAAWLLIGRLPLAPPGPRP